MKSNLDSNLIYNYFTMDVLKYDWWVEMGPLDPQDVFKYHGYIFSSNKFDFEKSWKSPNFIWEVRIYPFRIHKL